MSGSLLPPPGCVSGQPQRPGAGVAEKVGRGVRGAQSDPEQKRQPAGHFRQSPAGRQRALRLESRDLTALPPLLSVFNLLGPRCDRECIRAELQAQTGRLEADIRERSAQVETLTAQLEETREEKSQLTLKVASITSLLEASQNKKEEESQKVGQLDFLCRKGQTHISLTNRVCFFNSRKTLQSWNI